MKDLNKDFGIRIPTDEELRNAFERDRTCPENFSSWFPAISPFFNGEFIHTPRSCIIPITYKMHRLSMQALDDPGKAGELQTLLSEVDVMGKTLKDIYTELGPKVFIKTATFSGKFQFKHCCLLEDYNDLARQYCAMIYNAMVVWVPTHSTELIMREYIEPPENTPTIYLGMPLRTEFRVFYDFDTKKSLGIANYWHPKLMKDYLQGEDLMTFKQAEPGLVKQFDQHKVEVAMYVEKSLKRCDIYSMSGKWSIDIMLSGSKLYFIDMARMRRSALTGEMEKF